MKNAIVGTLRDLTAGTAGAGIAANEVANHVDMHMGANPMDSLEKLTITVGGAVVSTLFVRLVNFLFGLFKKK